jgi:hypothetical protein
MSIRRFEWRDLPTLRRYRPQSVYLHSTLVLTRGPLLLSGAMLSSLAPGVGIYTMVSSEDGRRHPVVIGQVMQAAGSQCAQLTFLTPENALESDHLPPLLEHISAKAIGWGAFRLLADVDEHSSAFDALHQAGFAIYARQRIWQLSGPSAAKPGLKSWRAARQRDLIAVRSLYNNLIPGLVQQVEPFPPERLHGLVFCQEGELKAYVELKYGRRGIWAQPFIHPDAEVVAGHLVELFQNLPHRRSRPVYVCVRTYQSWLEPAIEDLGGNPGPRQAIMVKHLAVPQKALRPYAIPALEGGQTEAPAPFAHSKAHIRETQPGDVLISCHNEE